MRPGYAGGVVHTAFNMDRGDFAAAVATEVQAVATVVACHGGLHVWANIAGIYPIYPIQDTLTVAPQAWQRVIAINLGGTFFGARAAAR